MAVVRLIDAQWSRSAQAIACVLLVWWLFVQLAFSYLQIIWLGLGLVLFLALKIVSAVAAYLTKREPAPPDGLFVVLWLALVTQARPIHGAVVCGLAALPFLLFALARERVEGRSIDDRMS